LILVQDYLGIYHGNITINIILPHGQTKTSVGDRFGKTLKKVRKIHARFGKHHQDVITINQTIPINALADLNYISAEASKEMSTKHASRAHFEALVDPTVNCDTSHGFISATKCKKAEEVSHRLTVGKLLWGNDVIIWVPT